MGARAAQRAGWRMSDADLVFLPWVRRGAAAALLDPDKFTSDQPGLASATASVTVNSGPAASVPVTVMGPGHVTGLDRRQVIRTDPAPGSRTFEPNYFPLIELDEPSLPWLRSEEHTSELQSRPHL